MAVLQEGVAPLILWILCGFLSYGAVPGLLPILRQQRKTNYLGEEIPTSLGYAFVIPAALVMVARSNGEEYALFFALTLIFFTLFGAIDDMYGDVSSKGFRGHLRGPHLSTGALKAWGGVAAALAITWPLSCNWLELITNGLVISLLANLLNLLDLRPGRAGKAFLLLALPLFLLKPQVLGPLFGLFWAVGGYLPWDLKRVVMMGDVGSNPLGAALGLGCVIGFSSLGFRIVLALILLALNMLSERFSFSRIIESNRFFRFLDQLGR